MTINWLKLWEKEERQTDGISKDLKALALAVALTASPMNVATAQKPAHIIEVSDSKTDSTTKKLQELEKNYGIDSHALTVYIETLLLGLAMDSPGEVNRLIHVFHKALQMWPEQYFTQKAETAENPDELSKIKRDMIIFAKAYSECWPVNWRAEIYEGLKAAAAKIKTAQQTAMKQE